MCEYKCLFSLCRECVWNRTTIDMSLLSPITNDCPCVFMHANSCAPLEREKKKQNRRDCIETFSQLVHILTVFTLIIPWCNETRGCQSDAAYAELCPSRREALNEKVTSHPPVKVQMPHQSNTWQEEQVSLLGTRDALGTGERHGYTAHVRELTGTQISLTH